MGRTRLPLPSISARRRHFEDGFTILEVAMTTSILMVVIVSLLGVFVSTQRSQAYVTDRAATLDDLRLAMDRLTKELRQATVIQAGATATAISVRTFVGGNDEAVTWQVSGGTLRRSDEWGGNVPVLTPITNTDVFTYSPSAAQPLVVTVRLQTRPRSSPDVLMELTSEIRLRNR